MFTCKMQSRRSTPLLSRYLMFFFISIVTSSDPEVINMSRMHTIYEVMNILDYSSSVTDSCNMHCDIDTQFHVFLRECRSCTVLVACQQLRTRDCRSLRIALHCSTQPIIEETSDAIFHPLALHYDSFIDDMIAAHLSIFTSYSTSVHDFTPEEGSVHYRMSSEVLSLVGFFFLVDSSSVFFSKVEINNSKETCTLVHYLNNLSRQ
uniref:C-CAP/cofactor C-like domain-containing protein n=1 Tax=Angiostrongylus cantonensis TaxID=6313 RepID=A0A0K0DBR2_ANGCA